MLQHKWFFQTLNLLFFDKMDKHLPILLQSARHISRNCFMYVFMLFRSDQFSNHIFVLHHLFYCSLKVSEWNSTFIWWNFSVDHICCDVYSTGRSIFQSFNSTSYCSAIITSNDDLNLHFWKQIKSLSPHNNWNSI